MREYDCEQELNNGACKVPTGEPSAHCNSGRRNSTSAWNSGVSWSRLRRETCDWRNFSCQVFVGGRANWLSMRHMKTSRPLPPHKRATFSPATTAPPLSKQTTCRPATHAVNYVFLLILGVAVRLPWPLSPNLTRLAV